MSDVNIKIGVDASTAKDSIATLQQQMISLNESFNRSDITMKDWQKGQRELGAGLKANEQVLRAFGESVEQISGKFDGWRGAVENMKNFGLAVEGVNHSFDLVTGGANKLLHTFEAGDEKLKFFNMIKTLSDEETATVAMEKINSLAIRMGVPLEQARSSFEHMFTILGKEVSVQQLTDLQEGFATMGRVAGASADQMNRAMNQIQQGLAIGKLGSGDLNAIAGSMPIFEDALAAAATKMQILGKDTVVTAGQMKVLAGQGLLTRDVLIEAMKPETVRAFAKGMEDIPPTMDQIKNRWNTISTLSKESWGNSSGLRKEMDALMTSMSQNIPKEALGGLLLAGEASISLGQTAAGLLAVGANFMAVAPQIGVATAAVRAFMISMGPIGWIATAIGVAAAAWEAWTIHADNAAKSAEEALKLSEATAKVAAKSAEHQEAHTKEVHKTAAALKHASDVQGEYNKKLREMRISGEGEDVKRAAKYAEDVQEIQKKYASLGAKAVKDMVDERVKQYDRDVKAARDAAAAKEATTRDEYEKRMRDMKLVDNSDSVKKALKVSEDIHEIQKKYAELGAQAVQEMVDARIEQYNRDVEAANKAEKAKADRAFRDKDKALIKEMIDFEDKIRNDSMTETQRLQKEMSDKKIAFLKEEAATEREIDRLMYEGKLEEAADYQERLKELNEAKAKWEQLQNAKIQKANEEAWTAEFKKAWGFTIDDVSDQFSQMILNTNKGWKDMLKSMVANLAQSGLKNIIKDAMSAFAHSGGGGGGGGWGGLLGGIGSIFGFGRSADVHSVRSMFMPGGDLHLSTRAATSSSGGQSQLTGSPGVANDRSPVVEIHNYSSEKVQQGPDINGIVQIVIGEVDRRISTPGASTNRAVSRTFNISNQLA